MCGKSDNHEEKEPLPAALVLKQITEEQITPIRQFCTAIGMVLNESGTPKAKSERIGKLLSISASFLARTLNATFLARRELVELNNQTNEDPQSICYQGNNPVECPTSER